MKYLFVVVLSLLAFQVQASGHRAEKIIDAVLTAVDVSDLDVVLAADPSDLSAVKRTLIKAALRDSEVAAEIRNILNNMMEDLTVAEGDQFRRGIQQVAQYRLLIVAGENGYVPQDQ